MKQNQAIFKPIFGDDWDKLPAVFHKHYVNRPYCDDIACVQGKMDVSFTWFVRLLSPALKLFGVLVPYEGTDIPVKVVFKSQAESNAFCLERTFYFPDKKPYIFFSTMIPVKNDIIIEYMKFGIGWKHRFYYNGEKVILEHRGYVWKVFNLTVAVPLSWIFGRVFAEEQAINDTTFRMQMQLSHPLFGKLYEYKGEFEIVGE